MKSIFIGFIGILGILVLSVEGNWAFYLQKHSILMVLGGSLFVFLFSTPDRVLKITMRSLVVLFTKREERLSDYTPILVQLAKSKKLSTANKNPLIQYAVELWSQGIDNDLFVVLLSQKRIELENETIDAVQALKNLSKYPPALGMIGTVMGMISLFSKLDSNKSSIGKDIALAMTATFFGLIVANALVSPLADRLQVRHVNYKRLYQNLYQVLLLINQGEPATLVQGEMEIRAVA